MNPHFLLLQGASALSEFRNGRLERRLSAIVGSEVRLQSSFVYLVYLRQVLTDEENKRLYELLGAQSQFEFSADAGAYLIAPHAGTLSPWSSKASDILQRCRLQSVARVERARFFQATHVLPPEALALLHDRMTQDVVVSIQQLVPESTPRSRRPLQTLELGDQPRESLQRVNVRLGLALSADEIDYLADHYQALRRDPTDAELMMFAQANSEHCRHKIFRGQWTIDGEARTVSLFDMIRHTHQQNPLGVLSAYSDNAAVLEGGQGMRLQANPQSGEYEWAATDLHVQIKAETHNHPTAISPYPGAATGSGGEIRDEAATGRGARPKAALCGFSVSDLNIPNHQRPWEEEVGLPAHMASSLQIMLEGPLGAAAYNNEFGRPALCGYFRTLTQWAHEQCWGYHKPIMLAGGLGNITPAEVLKQEVPVDAKVVVLGGPALLIGLGGGAASSATGGDGNVDLDYASVQRENPEMQRRCQQVIDHCVASGADNPIISIHDVGAGGLSNAIPELLHDHGRGGRIDLGQIPTADLFLSPMELWSNEAQERYVLAISANDIERFMAFCDRERCPAAVVGDATADGHFVLTSADEKQAAVDLALDMVLGKAPLMHRQVTRWPRRSEAHDWSAEQLSESITRVLRLPAVGSKQFLITIGDRSIGGLSARDQMVGPWQVPVADVAVTARDYQGSAGEAMAMGERTPLAIHNAPASGRMAVAEALMNLAAAPIAAIERIKLSANWMAAAAEKGQDADLFDTVKAVGMELCPRLGLAIPVGKDSLSMRVRWREAGEERQVSAPLSLIVSAFAPVTHVERVLTPQLDIQGETCLLLLEPFAQHRRMGGSALAQVWQCHAGEVPDVDDAGRLRSLFDVIQTMNREGLIHAYHDRSDGGLLVTVLEMALAGHCGVDLVLPAALNADECLPYLFNEEIGAVIQVSRSDLPSVRQILTNAGLADACCDIGAVREHGDLRIRHNEQEIYRHALSALQLLWAETSFAIARLRDDSRCVDEELEGLADWSEPGLRPRLGFDLASPPTVLKGRPKIAILREQGVNGHQEMAAAFMLAGFDAVDVHMSDLLAGRHRLTEFQGFAACGGFSYGDVLGAGQGWAKSILYHEGLRHQFADFFQRTNRFALGVCNGCQMLSGLSDLISGADTWPMFGRNHSEQFEARLSQVSITPTPSIFFTGMEGSVIPVAVAHGEGRARFSGELPPPGQVCMRYVEADGRPASRYPRNPNGSPEGITGLCNDDGRVTIMMPHPERLLRRVNFSWAPGHWGDRSPWMRMFENARHWCGES